MAYFREYQILGTQAHEQLKFDIGAVKQGNFLKIAVQITHNRTNYQYSYICPPEGDQQGFGFNGPNDGRCHYVRFLWELYSGNDIIKNGVVNSISVGKYTPEIKELLSYDVSQIEVSSELKFRFYGDPSVIYAGNTKGYYGYNPADGLGYGVDLSFDLDLMVPLSLAGTGFTLSYNNGFANIDVDNPGFKNGEFFKDNFKNTDYQETKVPYQHYYIPSEKPIFNRSSNVSITYYEDEDTVYKTDTINLNYSEDPIFSHWVTNVPLNGGTVDVTSPRILQGRGETSNRKNDKGQYLVYPTIEKKDQGTRGNPGEEITSDFVNGKVTFTAAGHFSGNNELKPKKITVADFPDGVEADGWIAEDGSTLYQPGDKISIGNSISLSLVKRKQDASVGIYTKNKRGQKGLLFVRKDDEWCQGKAGAHIKNNWRENNEYLDLIKKERHALNVSNPLQTIFYIQFKEDIDVTSLKYRFLIDDFPITEDFLNISNSDNKASNLLGNFTTPIESVGFGNYKTAIEFLLPSGKIIKTLDFFVSDYCYDKIESNSATQELKNYCIALLNIFSSIEKLNGESAPYANDKLTRKQKIVQNIKAQDLEAYKIANQTSILSNFEINSCGGGIGLSNVFESNFGISLKDGEDINDFSFSYENNTLQPYLSENHIYGMRLPAEEDFRQGSQTKSLTVTKNSQSKTINFSRLSGCYYTLSRYLDESDPGREVAQALYLYIQSIEELFPNN